MVLVLYEMQIASSRIWTQVTMIISYNGTHNTMGTSFRFYIYNLYMNSLLVTLFLNNSLEFICLYIVKWFQVFLSNSNNSI